MVVLESRVVRADEWQPVFLLFLTGTDVCDIAAEPLLAEQLVKLLPSLGLCIPPIILLFVRESLVFSAISRFTILFPPFLS